MSVQHERNQHYRHFTNGQPTNLGLSLRTGACNSGKPRDFRKDHRNESKEQRRTECQGFHGHAHNGCLDGRTSTGIPVYNVAMPLLMRKFPDRAPFRVFEIPLPPAAAA